MSTVPTPSDPNAIENWKELARTGKFRALAQLTADTSSRNVQACLWHSRALRALGNGQKANETLESFAQERTFAASVAELAELAEEFLQCQMLSQAARLATTLERYGSPHAHYLWAALWREKENWNQFERAIQALNRLGTPWNVLATIQRVWASLRRSRIEEAASYLASEHLNHGHPGVAKIEARLALARGEWETATTILDRVAVIQPLDWEWRGLAAIAASGEFSQTKSRRTLDQAISLFDESLKLQPRQAELLMNRARLHLILEDQPAADKDLLHALQIKPWYDAALTLRVQVLRASGKLKEAEAWLADQRKSHDSAKRAGVALDLQLASGASPRTIEAAASSLIATFKEDVTAWRTAGAALQSIKKLDEAARCYESALALEPSDTATLNNLAVLYRDRGDTEQAVRALALLDLGSEPAVRLNYALLCMQIGEIEQAEQHLKGLEAILPAHGGVLRGLAELALAREEIHEARTLAQRSLTADRSNPLAWQTLAATVKHIEGDKAALSLLNEGEAEAQPILPLRETLFAVARRVLPLSVLKPRVEAWISEDPNEVQYRLMMADCEVDACRFDHSERHLKDAAALDEEVGGPALVSFYLSRERYGAAETLARQLTRRYPTTMKHWGGLAEVLYRQHKPDRALESLERGLAIEPKRLALIRQKAGILLALERYDDAERLASQFDRETMTIESLQLHMDILSRANRLSQQCAVLEKAAAKYSDHLVIQQAYAQALEKVGRREEALEVFSRLHKEHPYNFRLLQNHVQILVRAEQISDAISRIEGYDKKAQLTATLAVALISILRNEGLIGEARLVLDRACRAYPTHLGLKLQRALLEKRCGDDHAEQACWRIIMSQHPVWQWFDEGLESIIRLSLENELERMLNDWRTKEPRNLAPWWAAFRAARALKRPVIATQLLDKIALIKATPSSDIVIARVDMWSEGWRLGESIHELREAIKIWPNRTELIERMINMQVKAGMFEECDALLNKLNHLLGDRQYSHYQSFFFNINCHPDWTESKIAEFYRAWYQKSVVGKLLEPRPYKNSIDRFRRLRIGYLSPDFRRHAVAYFSEPLFLGHDREQFQIFAYAHLDVGQADEYTDRFKTYVHNWVDTRGMGDAELARRIRDDGIDILIDLAGHTTNNRLAVMLLRPAPVQATWIFGAGQTTGTPEVGHILVDKVAIPETSDDFYAEKVVRVPIQGLPFRPADDAPLPLELPAMTNGMVTFGVVARPVRTNYRTLYVWADILRKVPNSILRFDHAPYAEKDIQERFLRFFGSHGIDGYRIDFRNTRPHWGAYHNIDILLDTFPAGSGTTVSEGLYMGRLPVTLRARPPMGRIPFAQLTAMGLAETCAAITEDDYVEKAVWLASDVPRLSELSKGLRERMKVSPLMDYKSYGLKVAEVYRSMWHEYCDQQDSMW